MSLRRRIVAASFAAVLAVGAASVLSAGTAAAAALASVGTAKATSVATLKILTPGASIRRKGKTEFKVAKDGAQLRVGDTVKTDGTGFVEVQYTDESYTRLDINSTFTINSLTDDQGNRKIEGSLDSGRAWNRTSALTESESFEQKGAGATAAVVGTAFAFECDGVGHCTLISAVHDVQYTTADGELKLLKPLEQCEATLVNATDTDLCNVPTKVTKDAFLASEWLRKNLYIDALLGLELPDFPDGAITISGTIEVQGTQVFAVVNPIVAPSPPGAHDDPPVPDCDGQILILGTLTDGVFTEVNQCADEIDADVNTWVKFLLLGADDESIQFTVLPSASAGFLEFGDTPPVDENCGGGSEGDGATCVKITDTYDPNTAFWYVPKTTDATSFDYEAVDGTPDPSSVPVNPAPTSTSASVAGDGGSASGHDPRGRAWGHRR